MKSGNRSSIFIVPRASTAWRGNEAGWITASGWAAAGQQLWGEALVATTDGVFSPQESMTFPRLRGDIPVSRPGRRLRMLIPEFLVTAYKDWQLKKSKPANWPIELPDVLKGKEVMLVWERHDLFPGPGRRLADKLGVPLVISVEAAVVWEARKWGVHRPGWGQWLERGEADSLKASDLVVCVSEEVRNKVIDLGVPAGRVIVSPNRVDSSVFHSEIDGREIAAQYDLTNKRVLGWTGSFRAFHGVESVVRAFKKVHEKYPDTLMMMVGDGLELERIKKMVKEERLTGFVTFPGRQPFTSIPRFVANFDIALVSAGSAEGFHYSPLKLREYLAAGKAVIAPRAGDLPNLFNDGSDLLFYQPGDAEDLAGKVGLLLDDSDLRERLQRRARSLFEKEGTWQHELKRVCEVLHLPY